VVVCFKQQSNQQQSDWIKKGKICYRQSTLSRTHSNKIPFPQETRHIDLS